MEKISDILRNLADLLDQDFDLNKIHVARELLKVVECLFLFIVRYAK